MAKTPPNGPAAEGFTSFTRHTLDCPPTVPVQVVSAGTATVKGCCCRRQQDAHYIRFRGKEGEKKASYIVLVDVGRALGNDAVLHQRPLGLVDDAISIDVALLARDLRRDVHGGASSELARAGGIDNSSVWAGAIGRHDVQGAGEGVADLRQGRAGLGYGGLDVG